MMIKTYSRRVNLALAVFLHLANHVIDTQSLTKLRPTVTRYENQLARQSFSATKYGNSCDDASITLDLAIEQQIRMRKEPPISTITWFHVKDNVEQPLQVIQDRAKQILKLNPWLNGRVVGGTLEYEEQGSASVNIVCSSLDSTLDRSIPIGHVYRETLDYTKINEQTGPLWKVTVLPSNSNADENTFAIVLSISHFIADSHTYYQVYNMLTSMNAPIIALEMECPPQSDIRAEEFIGSKSWKFCHGPMPLVKGALGMMEKIVLRRQGQELWFEVDTAQMERAKNLQSKQENDDGVDFVSTNDVLSSWFFRSTNCRVGLLCTNFRCKVPGHNSMKLGRNYWGVKVYSPQLYTSPGSIRKQLMMDGTTKSPDIPNFLEYMEYPMAITSSWTGMILPNDRTEQSERPDFETDVHIPLYDFATYCPANFCVLRTWTLQPGRTGVYLAGDERLLNHLKPVPPFLKPLMSW